MVTLNTLKLYVESVAPCLQTYFVSRDSQTSRYQLETFAFLTRLPLQASLRSWRFCGRSMNMKAAKPRKRAAEPGVQFFPPHSSRGSAAQTPTKPPATQATSKQDLGSHAASRNVSQDWWKPQYIRKRTMNPSPETIELRAKNIQ